MSGQTDKWDRWTILPCILTNVFDGSSEAGPGRWTDRWPQCWSKLNKSNTFAVTEPLCFWRAITQSCTDTPTERNSKVPHIGEKWCVLLQPSVKKTTEWRLEGCTTGRGRMLMDWERGEAKRGKLSVCAQRQVSHCWNAVTALNSSHLNSLSHSLSHLQCFLNGRVNSPCPWLIV